MPKKNKQTPGNAYYWFMRDLKERQGSSYKNMNLNEVAKAAGPIWQNMSKEQKRPYEERALLEKNRLRAAKLTSEGLDVELLELEEKKQQAKIQDMKDEINAILKTANREGYIHSELIFIIHINGFCYCASEDRYYPAEIGIAGFTLEKGVLPENVFHRIIKPGQLPLGYAGEATLRSNDSHQIKPPMADDNENNVEETFNEMKNFLSDRLEDSNKIPILYADEKHMKLIEKVLDTWCMDYADDTSLFKVYNLQYMFRILRNTVAGDNVWSTDTYSAREIDKDVNAYAKGLACDYHELTNVPVYCSRSVVVRYAFIICDNCCQDLNIDLVPGCHVPHDVLLPSGYRSSSRASVQSFSSKSSKSSVLKPNARDEDSESVVSFSSKSEWDNRSVASEASSNLTLVDDESFPTLGAKKNSAKFSPESWKGFTPHDMSSIYSKSSTSSYAGAIGTSGLSRRPADLPSSIKNSVEKLSLDSSTTGASYEKLKNYTSDKDNFPVLGLGRGRGISKGRGFKPSNNGH